MIKVLHCADLHLDKPFYADTVSRAEARRQELRGVFSSLMLYVKTNAIDIVLIAGDLFTANCATPETIALVKREMASVPSTRIVISPGNHDPYRPGGVYDHLDLPENVTVFREPTLSRVSFDDVGPDHDRVDVYGFAYPVNRMEQNPFAGHVPADPAAINLLCAHGDLYDPLSVHCPITKEQIRDSHFEYIALGHVHNPRDKGVQRIDNTWYGYSGSIEGHDFGEPGHRGVIVLEIGKHAMEPSVSWHFQRFSRKKYEVECLDITGCSDADEVFDRARRLLAEKNDGTDTTLRLFLTGEIPSNVTISAERLKERLSPLLFTLELHDVTTPPLNGEMLLKDPTLRGEVYRTLLPKLQSEDGTERQKAARALRIALTALEGGEITR